MKRAIQGFLVMVVLLFAVAAHAKLTASQIFDAVSPSIVVVRTYDTKGKARIFGSGVVVYTTIADEIYRTSEVIATNCHVIKNAAEMRVVHQGKEYSATLQYSDWDRDVCTLSVDGLNAPGNDLPPKNWSRF